MDAKEIREQTVRDAKENLILDAARKVFADKGFHETRLEDIGAAAGFSKASLYNYYEDKETIFLNLANRDFDGMMQKIRTESSPELPVYQAIENMLRTFLTFMGENFAFFFTVHNFRPFGQNGLQNTSKKHQELVAGFRGKLAQSMQLIIGVIKAAKKRGEVASPIDETVLAGYVTSLIRGVVFEWKLRGTRGDVEQEISTLMTFLCQGMQIGQKSRRQVV